MARRFDPDICDVSLRNYFVEPQCTVTSSVKL